MKMKSCAVRITLAAAVSVFLVTMSRADVKPNDAGPYKVVAASWIGGVGEDELVGAAILPDGTLLVAGNSEGYAPAGESVRHLSTASLPASDSPTPSAKKGKGDSKQKGSGFVARLSADGSKLLSLADMAGSRIVRMKVDGGGTPFVLAKAGGDTTIAGVSGSGSFVARLAPDLKQVNGCLFVEGADDFGIDANGEVVVLTKGRVSRFSADGKTQKWSEPFASTGDNRPGGIDVDSKSGTAVVTGYGMTRTGHEPYKDPYAYGFSREGKQVWAIWNPDPKREVDAKFGGNGLMADTTGKAVFAGADGMIDILLFADGGNSVCTRDPLNPDNKLDPAIMQGVYQAGPGFGFRGASKTSIIFRVDPATGKLLKGTWMSAWLNPQHANGLGMNGAAADEQGTTFIVGDSASGCPTKEPWFVAPPGGYRGGGYLAIFDKNFQMQQCGYFPGSSMKAVACRNGTVLIVGSAAAGNKAKDPGNASAPETAYPVPTRNPLQSAFAGGEKDGYFVVLSRTAR
jgi:hypothetical protein